MTQKKSHNFLNFCSRLSNDVWRWIRPAVKVKIRTDFLRIMTKHEKQKVVILTLILFLDNDIHVDVWKTEEQNTNWFAASVFFLNGGWHKMPRRKNPTSSEFLVYALMSLLLNLDPGLCCGNAVPPNVPVPWGTLLPLEMWLQSLK